MYKSSWYYSLTKPFPAPPNWIFMPVWIVLYIMIFTSFMIFISKDGVNKKAGLFYFFIQMLLNLCWSPAFFVLKDIALALIIVILLDIFVYLTIKEFYKISKIAGYLLIPYLIWILFATYLNAGYLLLNN